MSDPALEAAKRAWPSVACGFFEQEQDVMIAAAREALKPIQAKVEDLAELLRSGRNTESVFLDFLESLAPLIFISNDPPSNGEAL